MTIFERLLRCRNLWDNFGKFKTFWVTLKKHLNPVGPNVDHLGPILDPL